MTLVLLATACIRYDPGTRPVFSEAKQVSLTATQQTSNVVLLRLTNGSDSPIGYNLCASALERQDATWTQMPSDIMCTMELRTLSSGATATFEREIREAITPGTYRFRTAVESPLGVRSVGVVSNAISLQ
ncbi:MAG TPA: hypothetical protein VMS12_09510 [Thermoanaerobaculia bacterium]|nr:hypothetical protein [Thermoanaerobaculia bacterium]